METDSLLFLEMDKKRTRRKKLKSFRKYHKKHLLHIPSFTHAYKTHTRPYHPRRFKKSILFLYDWWKAFEKSHLLRWPSSSSSLMMIRIENVKKTNPNTAILFRRVPKRLPRPTTAAAAAQLYGDPIESGGQSGRLLLPVGWMEE